MYTIGGSDHVQLHSFSPGVAIILHIKGIEVSEDTITAHLTDGRSISVPLVWSWRLAEATPEQRANYEIIGDGEGVHWPDIDEDISAVGMLFGIPAPRGERDEPHPTALSGANSRVAGETTLSVVEAGMARPAGG